ncbi:MAG TPA: hypothetical protein VEW07_03470 [Solirubrobacterales bacterium]|nr:hypothetical protein [Solirubrobacterales bacterium]
MREIRDAQKAARALTEERDKLIREAVLQEERSYRSVGQAAGLAPSRVSAIVRSK